MPIFDRKPEGCFRAFKDHVDGLLSRTLAHGVQTKLEPAHSDDSGVVLQTMKTVPHEVIKLPTAWGTLYLALSQLLAAEKVKGSRWRLRTYTYSYRLSETADRQNSEPVLRWQYRSRRLPNAGRYCRNHLHSPATRCVHSKERSFQKPHVPTGWVTLEALVRFLVVDLDHKPPCGDEWERFCDEGERMFFEEFTSKSP